MELIVLIRSFNGELHHLYFTLFERQDLIHNKDQNQRSVRNMKRD